jgi:hypothetical protein
MRSVLLAALLVASTSQVFAQDTATPRSAPGATSGMNEGIAVHGDWVIEVRNRDGSVSHRRAFRNALVGRNALALLLLREVVPYYWQVSLVGGACESSDCVLFESTALNPRSPSASGTLTLAVSGAQLVMRGTVTANGSDPQGGQISGVRTGLVVCSADVPPGATCPVFSAQLLNFTSVDLATPIPLADGQIVSVTVTLSFS